MAAAGGRGALKRGGGRLWRARVRRQAARGALKRGGRVAHGALERLMG